MDLETKIKKAKAKYIREWYAANIEKQREYRRIYRSKHKEQQKLYAERCWNKKAELEEANI